VKQTGCTLEIVPDDSDHVLTAEKIAMLFRRKKRKPGNVEKPMK
jgi:hypothetical protein